MNKQFDVFVKMKCKELSENISRMTYAYIQPDTKQPTVVPAKHYKDILDQPVEVMIDDAVKKQFLGIMYKQMKALKEEEPELFYQTLMLMDMNKTPDSLELNEEVALKLTAKNIVDQEKTKKKKFRLIDSIFHRFFEDTRDDADLMAKVFNGEDIYKEEKEEKSKKNRLEIALS